MPAMAEGRKKIRIFLGNRNKKLLSNIRYKKIFYQIFHIVFSFKKRIGNRNVKLFIICFIIARVAYSDWDYKK